MSYEGYEQLLCANGHYWINDDIYNYDDTFGQQCSVCSTPAIWWNGVDTTNGSFDDTCLIKVRIDNFVQLEVLNEITECECKCGHKHPFAGKPTTYKLPAPSVGHHRFPLEAVNE